MAEKNSASLSGELLASKGAASTDGFTLADAAITRSNIKSSYRWRLVIISATIAISFAGVTIVGAALFYNDRWTPAVRTERMVEIPSVSTPGATPESVVAAPVVSPAEPPTDSSNSKPATESLLALPIVEPTLGHDFERRDKPAPADLETAADQKIPLLAAAPSNPPRKPLAEEVARSLSKQHADKIATKAKEPPTVQPKTPAPPVLRKKSDKPGKLLASINPDIRSAAAPPPRPKKRPRYVPRSAYRVQLHALGSDAAVRREWQRLRKRHRALFSGLKLKVAPKRTGAGKKTVYRMQLGALSSRTKAKALCKKLQRRKMNCIVVR